MPLSTDTADGFSAHEREERLGALLRAYGTSDTPADLRGVVVRRLMELADFSDTMAGALGSPKLREHAALYRQDAVALS